MERERRGFRDSMTFHKLCSHENKIMAARGFRTKEHKICENVSAHVCTISSGQEKKQAFWKQRREHAEEDR